MLDSHDVAERARLISHRLYAQHISQSPMLLEQARARLERGATTEGEEMWLQLLKRQPREIIQRMTEDTPEGRLLRSNSPFSVLIGVSDVNERRRIWNQAKSELSRAQTSREPSVA